jgi:hypothetical protein
MGYKRAQRHPPKGFWAVCKADVQNPARSAAQEWCGFGRHIRKDIKPGCPSLAAPEGPLTFNSESEPDPAESGLMAQCDKRRCTLKADIRYQQACPAAGQKGRSINVRSEHANGSSTSNLKRDRLVCI